MEQFDLPAAIIELVNARNKVRDHYNDILLSSGSDVALKFTFDGNLIGDIGEALAVQFYSIQLDSARSKEGIDGCAPCGRTVQVKATGTNRGPAFRNTKTHADHLLFFDLDLVNYTGKTIFNGPEVYARNLLKKDFKSQRSLTARQIRLADQQVRPDERLLAGLITNSQI